MNRDIFEVYPSLHIGRLINDSRQLCHSGNNLHSSHLSWKYFDFRLILNYFLEVIVNLTYNVLIGFITKRSDVFAG